MAHLPDSMFVMYIFYEDMKFYFCVSETVITQTVERKLD